MNLCMPICIQSTLARLEGVSLSGMHVDSAIFEALSRMPMLRILIMDDVESNNMHFAIQAPRLATLLGRAGLKVHKLLSGFQLPRLAMISWRNANGNTLPFAFTNDQISCGARHF